MRAVSPNRGQAAAKTRFFASADADTKGADRRRLAEKARQNHSRKTKRDAAEPVETQLAVAHQGELFEKSAPP